MRFKFESDSDQFWVQDKKALILTTTIGFLKEIDLFNFPLSHMGLFRNSELNCPKI